MACIRRLFSEAYSTIAADIRSKVEASDEAAVKKLAPAERSQRLQDQQKKLAGLDIRGNLEPGDSLIDRCVAAYESDRISYVSWEVCVSRDHEILTGSKKDNGLTFDTAGHLKLTKKDQVEPCNTSNEMAVKYCLTRRGLALDQANVMCYMKHDRLAEKLINARMEEAPVGCVRLTLKQIEAADKKFWTLMAVQKGTFAHCHACAFGGTRPKKTSFLSNRKAVGLMQKFCDDVEPHTHEPWGCTPSGGFATALEAQYPTGMCEQLVKVLDEICSAMGVQVQPADQKLPRVDKQSRGRATPQLVPEYETVSSLLLSEQPPLDNKRCLTKPCQHVPEGSRLLRSEKKGKRWLCVFGIFHTCERFVSLARNLWHPFDTAAHMPDHLLRCLHEHLTKSPVELVKLRIQRLKLWTTWASSLSEQETDLKNSCDPKVKLILGPKRILLMRQVAESIGWPDMALFDELATGFRLVGTATKSNICQQGIKAASMSEQQLMRDAKFLKPALLGKIKANKGRPIQHGAL